MHRLKPTRDGLVLQEMCSPSARAIPKGLEIWQQCRPRRGVTHPVTQETSAKPLQRREEWGSWGPGDVLLCSITDFSSWS